MHPAFPGCARAEARSKENARPKGRAKESARPKGRAYVLLLIISAAVGLRAQSDHAYTTEDIQNGMKLYASQCQQCHGQNGDTVQGINLRRQQFRKPLSDEDLRATISIGVPGTGMPPFNLQSSELDGLVAFIRAGFDADGMAVKVGSAARGQALFDGKGGCTSCHRVKGKGPRVAPDLSDIGSARQVAQLYRSLTDPVSQMMPINRPVRIVTRDGRTIRGRRLNEDSYTVQLIDDQERLVSLDKSEIRELEASKTSPMPSATKTLNAEEISDMVAYLLSLRGQL
jgi:cytochrome c oxidase cbb3-type subunit III